MCSKSQKLFIREQFAQDRENRVRISVYPNRDAEGKKKGKGSRRTATDSGLANAPNPFFGAVKPERPPERGRECTNQTATSPASCFKGRIEGCVSRITRDVVVFAVMEKVYPRVMSILNKVN